MDTLLATITFASEKHRDQRRKNKFQSPYINHPIGVSNLIANIGNYNDLVTLQAAVLHDTVEDTDCTFDEIETCFGKEVADIVKEVTDNKSLSKVERKKLQVVNAPHKSFKAKVVKLADKLHNLLDLRSEPPAGWSESIILGYFVWSYFVVQGLRGTNEGLEQALDDLFKLVIPTDLNLEEALEQYYMII